MIIRLLASIVLITASGCGKNDPKESAEDTDSGIEETDTEPTGFPSTFENGQFRVSSFSILESSEGIDIDGDGEIDNNLESLLTLINPFLDGDFSREGMNDTIAVSMGPEVNELVILIEAAHADLQLEIQLLTGAIDSEVLTVDPRSYDADGKALSLFEGEFSSETEFLAESNAMVLMIPFYPAVPPFPITLELPAMSGTLTNETTSGMLTGVIAGDVLFDQVAEPLIMANPALDDSEKANFLAIVSDILASDNFNENIADIDLGAGRRGISTAFAFGAESSSW